MGGKENVRGILLQTIICVLDLFNKDNDWIHVSLEPDINAEKVDILWDYIDGKKKVVQVKSKEKSITMSFAENWATLLESDYIADSYELILIGPCEPKLTNRKNIGKVSLKIKNLDLDSLLNNAAFSLGSYLERKGVKPLNSNVKKTIIEALVTIFAKYSTQSKFVSRNEFDDILNEKIKIYIPTSKDQSITTDLKDKFQKLYTILFETDHSDINRAELITLIDNEIGHDNISKILKLRYKKEYSDSTGEVISLFNEKWRINCQSGLEAGHGLNALNIYNADMKIFHYGRKNQDKKILEDFRRYFFDECQKSGINVDELYRINQITKIYKEYEKKKKEKSYGRRSVF